MCQSFLYQRGSCRELAKEILAKRGKEHCKSTIHNFMIKSGHRPFRVIAKPLKTNLNRENRLFLANFVKNFDEAELEFDQNLFQDLLCSMPRRFRRVRDATDGETDY